LSLPFCAFHTIVTITVSIALVDFALFYFFRGVLGERKGEIYIMCRRKRGTSGLPVSDDGKGEVGTVLDCVGWTALDGLLTDVTTHCQI
jgi:hypothetical protein